MMLSYPQSIRNSHRTSDGFWLRAPPICCRAAAFLAYATDVGWFAPSLRIQDECARGKPWQIKGAREVRTGVSSGVEVWLKINVYARTRFGPNNQINPSPSVYFAEGGSESSHCALRAATYEWHLGKIRVAMLICINGNVRSYQIDVFCMLHCKKTTYIFCQSINFTASRYPRQYIQLRSK